MNQIRLKPGRERSLLNRHPWVFSGAIEKTIGDPAPGETVEIVSSNGEWLAHGAYSPTSSIRARVWSWDRNESIGELFFKRRIQRSSDMRDALFSNKTIDAYRVIFAESDGLPGVIADRYNQTIVVQFLSAGAEFWREVILNSLWEQESVETIYERSDVEVRKLEGLEERTGLCRGMDPPQKIELVEENVVLNVDVRSGHKTGFYLDQRDHRQMIKELPDKGRLLNCFCYTGAFTVAGMIGGAQESISIDSSADAVDLAREHIKLNQLGSSRAEFIVGDVFSELRTMRDRRESFDTIILDPPKFAPTASQVQQAARGYKDINLLAFKLLRPGGRLITFSCSGGISRDLFQKIVADAARDAAVNGVIEKTLSQPADHPISLQFPESRYLKGLVCRVVPD